MPLYAHYVIFVGKSVHGSNGTCPYQPTNDRFLLPHFFVKTKTSKQNWHCIDKLRQECSSLIGTCI